MAREGADGDLEPESPGIGDDAQIVKFGVCLQGLLQRGLQRGCVNTQVQRPHQPAGGLESVVAVAHAKREAQVGDFDLNQVNGQEWSERDTTSGQKTASEGEIQGEFRDGGHGNRTLLEESMHAKAMFNRGVSEPKDLVQKKAAEVVFAGCDIAWVYRRELFANLYHGVIDMALGWNDERFSGSR